MHKEIILVFLVSYLLVASGQNSSEYLSRRKGLVSAEYNESLSGLLPLSPQEEIANGILAQLLVKEAGVMGDYFPPAINFFKAHGWILNTSVLFPLVQKMPKGVVHHLHYDSAATYDWLIENATYSPNCYIYQGKSDVTPYGALQMFYPKPPSSDWVSVSALRVKSGNPEEFDENLLVSLTLQNDDYGDYIFLWNTFDTVFGRVSGLIKDKETFEGYFQHMVTQMLADGVQNIEVKMSPTTLLTDLSGNTYDFDYIVTFVYGVINATKVTNPYFTIKLIMSTNRGYNSSTILPLLELSLAYRNKYPDLVVGFDLVGPEDEGYTLLYFLQDFLTIANISQNYTYQLPYYFHAGETLMANNTNLYDAVLLGSFRIGHAFQLARHPLLIEMVKNASIGLEICPISNQILQYCYDLRGHPALDYFNRGLLITISPDDPAIYGYGGVSFDWYEVLLGWGLDIPGLKQMALNSYVKGSFFSEQEQEDSMEAWLAEWNAWIAWVVATYGE